MQLTKAEDLEFVYPDCTVCPDRGDMNTDGDSWWCEKCGASWDYDGTHGEYDLDEAI